MSGVTFHFCGKKTLFNKLWLLLDKSTEFDLKLTNGIVYKFQFVLLTKEYLS